MPRVGGSESIGIKVIGRRSGKQIPERRLIHCEQISQPIPDSLMNRPYVQRWRMNTECNNECDA